jgi:hypothetical protein
MDSSWNGIIDAISDHHDASLAEPGLPVPVSGSEPSRLNGSWGFPVAASFTDSMSRGDSPAAIAVVGAVSNAIR